MESSARGYEEGLGRNASDGEAPLPGNAGVRHPPIPWPYWMEWRERCAAALCSAEARGQIETFVGAHFNRQTQRYLHRTNVKSRLHHVPASECMQRFESSMLIDRAGHGKAYKEWLFTRAEGDQAMAALEGGAVLLIRDVVRDFLRREHSPSFMVSLSEPVDEFKSGDLTLEDLLPCEANPADEAAARDLEQLALWHAQQLAGELDRRERIAILAREIGLSLAHPEVERAAGCRKSVLHETHKKLYERVAHDLKRKYEEEDLLAVKALTIETIRALTSFVASQARSDKTCDPLFAAVEGA